MTEIELYDYFGKNIEVTCKDGDIIKGHCAIVTQAIDNTPEVAEISLECDYYPKGMVCITLPEIQSIKILN